MYYPALKEDDSNQPLTKGEDSHQPQPRKRPQLLRSPEIPACLAFMESRLSGASEGFDIGPDMVFQDRDDHETGIGSRNNAMSQAWQIGKTTFAVAESSNYNIEYKNI